MSELQTVHETAATVPSAAAPSLTLSPDQEQAIGTIIAGFAAGKTTQTLSGAGGTGKTTCMKEILKRWPGPIVLAAPTNIAARVLSTRAGQQAFTLHALAYSRPVIDEETGELKGFVRLAAAGQALTPGTLVICDETSMVGTKLHTDLMAALPGGVQVLFVGDWAQLRPVKARAAVDLEQADAMLTLVHRQAAGSPILVRATELRTQKVPLTVDRVRQWGIPIHHVTTERLGAFLLQGGAEQVITRTNRARWLVNEGVRKAQGAPPLSAGPRKGDRVIAITTNKNLDIPNGEQGTVTFAKEGRSVQGAPTWFVGVDWGVGIGTQKVVVPKETWCPASGKPWDLSSALEPFSLIRQQATAREKHRLLGLQAGWAVTTHKYQGSQADKGVIVLEPASAGRDDWRLGYTQLTRFAQRVWFVTLDGLPATNRRPGGAKNRSAPVEPPEDLDLKRFMRGG